MKKWLIPLVALAAAACAPASEKPACPPSLEKTANGTRLVVDGKPFLVLGCELKNSSSSSKAYMEPVWQSLKETGVNTVIGSISWEQVEPEEGVFDFRAVDDMVLGARENGFKLVFIWFASWKNGITSYTPAWVKRDPERFPLALTLEGKQLPILTTLSEASAEADAKAFAATMKHLREIDGQEHTVLMIQVENEVGLHGHTRDYHPLAVKAYDEAVPSGLMAYLSENEASLLPETREAWERTGKPAQGSWAEVFAPSDRADEFFMAWHYASYLDRIAEAGKAEYDLPMFVNAWIVQPEDSHPGNYPSGGPQAQCHDIWRAAAPHIDILSPDIYLPDYPSILRMYSRSGNPVFVPESRAGIQGAANAAFTFGEMGGIGYSPFGLDAAVEQPANEPFYEFYRLAGTVSDRILQAQSEGRICGAWLKGSDPFFVKDERVLGDWRICFELVSSGMRNGGAPQLTGGTYDPAAVGYAIVIDEGNGSLLVLGANVRITFRPSDGEGTVGLAKVTEGCYTDGEWVEGRWLNGDEIQLRYDLLYAVEEGVSGQGLNFDTPHPGLIRVELFKY